jgi:serine/threonine-protein kinase RsbW
VRPTRAPADVTPRRPKPDDVQGLPAPPSSWELSEPATPAAIARLRHAAHAFAAKHGAAGGLLDDIGLAVSEAVTNAVKYAYQPAEQGRVRLVSSIGDGWLEFIVADCGGGFHEGVSSGLGLGLSIIAEVTTELTIEQAATGTEVRMRFALSGH